MAEACRGELTEARGGDAGPAGRVGSSHVPRVTLPHATATGTPRSPPPTGHPCTARPAIRVASRGTGSCPSSVADDNLFVHVAQCVRRHPGWARPSDPGRAWAPAYAQRLGSEILLLLRGDQLTAGDGGVARARASSLSRTRRPALTAMQLPGPRESAAGGLTTGHLPACPFAARTCPRRPPHAWLLTSRPSEKEQKEKTTESDAEGNGPQVPGVAPRGRGQLADTPPPPALQRSSRVTAGNSESP